MSVTWRASTGAFHTPATIRQEISGTLGDGPSGPGERSWRVGEARHEVTRLTVTEIQSELATIRRLVRERVGADLNRPEFCGDLAGWISRGDDGLALTMVEDAVDLAQLVPLRGVAADVHGEGQRRW